LIGGCYSVCGLAQRDVGLAAAVGSCRGPGASPPPGSKKVHFVGFDASAPLVNALRAKKLEGLVVQDPYRWASSASRRSSLTSTEAGRARDRTGETLVTPENMDERGSRR